MKSSSPTRKGYSMELDFFKVLAIVGVLIALCIPGYILRKIGKIRDGAVTALVAVLIFVCQPLLSITSFQGTQYTPELLRNIGIVFAASLGIQLLIFFLVKLIYGRFRIPVTESGVYMYASVFPNCGFMGIPVVRMLFPDRPELVLYAAVFMVSFNILSWTVGIYMLTGDKSKMKLWKAFINPPILPLVIALPLFFFNVRLADYVPNVYEGLVMLADMTTPIAMIIMGVKLAEVPFKEIFANPYVYVVSFVKLLAAPLLLYVILLPFTLDQVVRVGLVLLTAMPSAASVVAYAENFGSDARAAAKAMLACSLLSVACIPLVALIL